MENASKALIIAGAILISILLISVGILIFNSISGTTDTAGLAGDAMEIAARKERVKMILSSTDLSDDNVFFEYIKSNYGTWVYTYETDHITLYNLTAESARELAELVTQRCIMFYGEAYVKNTLHITSATSIEGFGPIVIYYDATNNKFVDDVEENKTYRASVFKSQNAQSYSISIYYYTGT